MIQRLRRENGYSLVEMITVMAIMGVVLGGLTQVFTSASKADTDMSNRFEAQLNARLALDKLRRDIHCAYDVSPNTPNPWTSAQSTVTLKITNCGSDISYCTASLGTNRWGLYRQSGSTCSSGGGIKIADYLTTATPFSAFAHVVGCGCLASLGVDLPVSIKGSTIGQYRLKDTIFLRNSTRI